MRKIIVNMPVNCHEDDYTQVAADIIDSASNIFGQLEVELDADEENSIIINLAEISK